MATGAFVAATVIGTALTIQGNKQAAEAQERNALGEAALKGQQAEDLFQRFQINRKSIFRQGQQVEGAQKAGFAKGGVAVGEGSTLLALEDTIRSVKEAIDIEAFETNAQIAALKAGADLDVAFGQDIRNAERVGRLGTLLTGASSIASFSARRGSRGLDTDKDKDKKKKGKG